LLPYDHINRLILMRLLASMCTEKADDAERLSHKAHEPDAERSQGISTTLLT